MRETWFLFRHFWKADVRSQHSIAGLVLFAIATVYAAYQVVQGHPEPETWNALAWIILLFTAFNGVSRTLEEDRSEVLAYLRTAVQPLHFMLARTLHNVVVLTGLACLVVFFMGLLLGWAKLDGMRIAGLEQEEVLQQLTGGDGDTRLFIFLRPREHRAADSG